LAQAILARVVLESLVLWDLRFGHVPFPLADAIDHSRRYAMWFNRHVVSLAAFLLAISPSLVHAFFEQIFGGGGGNTIQFQMGGGHRPQPPKWPRGVPDEVSKKMAWLKGTEWQWSGKNFNLKLERDGNVEAPINQCQMSGMCRWAADKGKVYIQLGDAGMHEVSAPEEKPANLKGIRMKGARVTLVFQRIFDHEAADLEKDLYQILGLPDDATEDAIKKVYRKLSIKYHPDKNPDEASKAMFAEIRDAYEILNDPDKKILYDTGGMDAVQKNAKGDIEKTDDYDAEVTVSLAELYTGSERKVGFQRRIVCRGCRAQPDNPRCRGCGKCPNEVKTVNVQMGPFMTQQQQEVPSKEKCKQESTSVVLHIERGMRDRERLTFPRMSQQRPGMLPGAVIVTLKVTDHPRFIRRGDDLHMDMTVSLREALLGWSQTIRHIDGHTVELSSSDVTKHLQVLMVEGEGMPLRDDPSSFGNLYVKVKVTFPGSLTKTQRDGIASVFAADPKRQEL